MPPETSAIVVLGAVARAKAIANSSDRRAAEDFLTAIRAPAQAERIFKAAVGAGSTVNNDLGDIGIAIGAWSDSLRTRSAFYRILSDGGFTRVPIRTRVGMVTSAPTAGVVAEGKAIPVSRVTLDNIYLEPIKASALIVVTNELLRDVSAAGQSLFNRELASVVSDAVDSAFLNMIISTATTSNPSSGTSSVDAKLDLRTALLAVNTVGAARLYWIAAPDVAKKASTLADTAGGDAFAAMSASGGEMANLPAIVATGVPAGTLYLVDASGLAADGGPVSVEASGQADISMLDNPTMDGTTGTGASLVSMFQTNSSAIRANAFFGAAVLRDDAISVVTGINWG